VSVHPKDTIVYQQAGPADAVFDVQKGRIKIAVASRQGKEAVIAILGRVLRKSAPAPADERGLTRVSKAELARVLHEEAAFGELFTAHLLTRNSRIEEDLINQLFNSGEKRLAWTLLLLANFGKQRGPQQITASITQAKAGLAEIHRHDATAGQPFHEHVQEAWFHLLHGQLRCLVGPKLIGRLAIAELRVLAAACIKPLPPMKPRERTGLSAPPLRDISMILGADSSMAPMRASRRRRSRPSGLSSTNARPMRKSMAPSRSRSPFDLAQPANMNFACCRLMCRRPGN